MISETSLHPDFNRHSSLNGDRSKTLGLMGGGQLGMMFAQAAQGLGYGVVALEPSENCPAAPYVSHLIVGEYDHFDAVDALADRSFVATTEFENVPSASLERLATKIPVRPSAQAVSIAQDRMAEKRFFASAGVPVAPHAPILSELDCHALPGDLFPGILKTARLGYDGKGQATVFSTLDVLDHYRQWGAVPCVLERRLNLRAEVSVIVARDARGAVAVYPVTENLHRQGILALSVAPARLAKPLLARAQEAATHLATALAYQGVMCVEYFVVEGGGLIANEMAPRPHNSGHWTIEGCRCSQFEQQARVMADLPLGSTELLHPAAMLNLLGDLWFAEDGNIREPRWDLISDLPGVALHLYGKAQARPGRKMGHITVIGDDLSQVLAITREVEKRLGIDAPAVDEWLARDLACL